MESFGNGFLSLGPRAGRESRTANAVLRAGPNLEMAQKRAAGNKQRAHEIIRLPLDPRIGIATGRFVADFANVGAPAGHVGALWQGGIVVSLLALEGEALHIKVGVSQAVAEFVGNGGATPPVAGEVVACRGEIFVNLDLGQAPGEEGGAAHHIGRKR